MKSFFNLFKYAFLVILPFVFSACDEGYQQKEKNRIEQKILATGDKVNNVNWSSDSTRVTYTYLGNDLSGPCHNCAEFYVIESDRTLKLVASFNDLNEGVLPAIREGQQRFLNGEKDFDKGFKLLGKEGPVEGLKAILSH